MNHAAPPKERRRPIRVVIVDDHPIMLEATRSILRRYPEVEVVGVATNGASAIRLVGEVGPRVLLLDLRLPDMNGTEVVRQVTASFPEVAIVILTGYDDASDVRHLVHLGVHGYLEKTASGAEMMAAIEAAAESGFDDLYILPPAGDAGVSIGGALYSYHVLLGNPQRRPLESAATGRSYDEADVHAALAGAMAHVEWHKAEPSDVARLIADHYVVGWVQGGSEMGPRALGQRSILADPRHPHMRDYLNRIVKHREVFRPYAPSVLFEHAND